jgi:hypothetical protein
MTRINANKTREKEKFTKQNLCSFLSALCSLKIICPRMDANGREKACHLREGGNLRAQFSGTVPAVIWHDFRKIWFGKEKTGRWRV